MSDSEGGTSENAAVICRETESHILLESQITQLQEKIDMVTKENVQLKAQFAQAVQLSSDFEKATQENVQLSKELSNIKLQKEDLENRLAILVKAREELEAAILHEKRENEKARLAERGLYEKELADAKAKTKQEIDLVTAEHRRLEDEKDTFMTKVKQMENERERLLSSANEYFKLRFHSLGELTEHLDKPVLVPITSTGPNSVDSTNDKSKLHALEKANAKLKQRVLKLETQIKKMEKKKTTDADPTGKQMNMEIEEKDMVISNQQNQIKALEAQVLRLKAPTPNESIHTGTFERVFTSSFERPPYSVTDNDSETRIEELQRQMRSLKRELGTCQDSCQTLTAEKNKLERDKEDTGNKQKKLESELTEAQTKLKACSEELDQAKQELDRTKKQVKILSTRELKIETLLAKEANFSNKIQALESEIGDLQTEREDLRKVITDRDRQIKNMSEQLEKQDRQMKDMKSELDRKDIIQANTPKVEDPLSHFSLKCSLFDTTLCAEIDKIVATMGLQISSKVQNIYKAIHQYYSSKLTDLEEAAKSESDKVQAMSKSINQFLIEVCVLLSLRQISVDEFVSRNGQEFITSSITDIRTSYDEIRRSRDSFQAFAKRFQEAFGLEITTDPPKLVSQLKDVHSILEMQKHKLSKRTKQCSKLKKSILLVQRQLETRTSDLNEESERLQAEIAKLTNDVKELTVQSQKQKRRIHDLEQDLAEQIQLQEESEAAAATQQQRLVTEQANAETELRNQIRDLTTKNEEANLKISEYEAALAKAKKQLEAANVSITAREQEAAKIETQRSQLEQQMKMKCEDEKASIVQTYERTIQNLKQQCEEQRRDVTNLQSELKIAQKGQTNSKTHFAQLKLAYESLQREMMARLEQAERERKLTESSARSRIVAAETALVAKSAENSASFESEKRRIYLFVAEQFRQFFDPHKTIDEKSFRDLIMRVKRELDRLSACDNSVRRIVGAEFQQRTDDAVCQALSG